MTTIGVGTVRLGRKQEVGECGGRVAAGNGRQQSTFGRLPMPHSYPAAQPPLQGGKIGVVCKRCPVLAWGGTVTVVGHVPRAVKQGQVFLFIRQGGQKLAKRTQDGQASVPAIAVTGAEQSNLSHNL